MSGLSGPAVVQTAGRAAGKSAARRRRLAMTSQGRRAGRPTYLILAAVLIGSAYPLYYTLQIASAKTEDMHDAMGFGLGSQLWSNLSKAFGVLDFWKALTNTLIVAATCSLAMVFFCTLAGYSFAKLRFRGKGPLLIFVIATMAIPAQLSAVPMFIIMSKLKLYGSLPAVILPGVVTAFGVFWMTQYLETALPYELIEAARVDGCSMIRTFWHVAMPAARPAAAMLALFTFVAQWTNYYWPFLIIGTRAQDVPLLTLSTARLAAGTFQDNTLIMAGVALTTFPLVALFALAGKQLVSGIMAGAVKG
ncbi:MAG: carbohydrate ABC transporter permease [Bifidobacteriaceae bacterium]|jgi:cellobiose transport system permease protein|nr:carbohydrate ABC transporter permease [Bifidobacteriaceae bacterium]